MNVIVALHTHKYGAECRVFKRPEQVEAWQREIAQEWWDKELPDEDKPDDPGMAAHDYFFLVPGEFFKFYEVELES